MSRIQAPELNEKNGIDEEEALFELQSRHNINYPEGDEHASELINISDKLLETRGIDKSLLPQDLLR
ncbi:hypothetical protein PGT21_033187 [Puccinia graminis f. sp. tritici]|uniref:Uncharacterized protein n=1 Tax=Puccinia graminis f. sp. tritici TaxID=56615 RepID=A0A5B0M743_PUCGR|nr:hypothetical protein PGT21_033187 [Puccinia graminis f. sp. tritici]